MLNTGPDLANKLIGVLLRFCNFPFTLVADIEGMFHQVQVAEKDRDSLRFLWVESETSEKISTYQMKVHIFGATDSPCCASYALRRTAEDNKDDYSEEAYQTVLRNFYVDDLLKSVDHENGLLRIANEVASMLRRGGFNLTKFISNSRFIAKLFTSVKTGSPSPRNGSLHRCNRQSTRNKVACKRGSIPVLFCYRKTASDEKGSP